MVVDQSEAGPGSRATKAVQWQPLANGPSQPWHISPRWSLSTWPQVQRRSSLTAAALGGGVGRGCRGLRGRPGCFGGTSMGHFTRDTPGL